MSTEKISSIKENQEDIETRNASSSQPTKCQHDGDCPAGYRCVNGECVPE